jgi:phosphate-selective porin OprO/OprP
MADRGPAGALRAVWRLAALGLAAAARAQEPAGAGYDDGFYVRDAAGANELVFKGFLQLDGRVFDPDRDPASELALGRMRPELEGRLAGWMRFRIEPNFEPSGVSLAEAWLGAEWDEGRSLLALGRPKQPFGLEEMRPRRFADFPRFSLLNQLSPKEDQGLVLTRRSAKGCVTWSLGLGNGGGGAETDDGKDLAARIAVAPAADRPSSAWRNLHLGGAVTWGEEERDAGGTELVNEAGSTVVELADGAALDGERWRAGLELAWHGGPWQFQAEALRVEQEMSLAGARETIVFDGAYAQLAWCLTGEDKTPRGVVPARAFDPRSGAESGPGAWVLAARWSRLAIGDELADAGLALPGRATSGIDGASLGVDWIPNRHAILRAALVASAYDEAIDLGQGSDDRELAVLLQVQAHY